MNTEKYNELSEKILNYIRKGIKNEDLISNLVFEGYAYKDIVFVMNSLINEGKIRGGNVVLDEDASSGAKSIDDAFSSSPEPPSEFNIWIKKHKKNIKIGLISFFVFIVIGAVYGFMFYNSPERQLSRAFYKIFNSNSFSYEVVMQKDFSDKNDVNFDKLEINLEGSLILNNLNRGVSINSKSYMDDDLIEEINIKSTFLSSNKTQEDYSLISKFNDFKLSNTLNQWIKYDNINKLLSVLPDIQNKNFIYFLKGIYNLDDHQISKIKDIFINKDLFSGIDVYEDDLGMTNINFSLSDVGSIELENVIRGVSKINDIKGQFLSYYSWVVKLDDKGYLSEMYIKSKKDDSDFTHIKFNNFNSNFEISKPSEFIELSDSF